MPEDKGLTRSERPAIERAGREEKVLQFWKDNRVFEKTLKKTPKGEFIFYEGPPGTNGLPHIGHLEARAFKDVIPRYKTMRGYHVPRKAGWDTHGLPVELEVEKDLGIKSKKEIEQYGIADFNKKCRESALKYIHEWRNFTERIGYWMNLDDAYYTYDNSYIQSVWSILSHVEKRKLLYKDYKVLPWCPRCGTALSSHELAQGYQDVKDLSVYVKFKIKDFPDAYFLAWTTTPWTLAGNVALAVGKDITYVEVKVGEEILVLAKNKLALISDSYEILAEHQGSEMVGMAYEPLYPFLLSANPEGAEKAYKVYTADFVTTEDGTGIVHTAVMYGQEDFELGTQIGLPKYHLVNEAGLFKKGTEFLENKNVTEEETAVEVIKDLAHRGLLFKKEKYEHSYPFCWRCKTRLIYYARDSWYIRMSSLREDLLKENKGINWEPDHIKEGRFGEWLREVKDWAISRERYWGTPLPIWQNADGKKRLMVDSLETLKKYSRPSANRYIVMRHGEAQSNTENILNGDPKIKKELTEAGRSKVKETSKKLRKDGITRIFCSELERTIQTADIIKAELGGDIEVARDARLNEIGFGELEGKSIEEYRDKYPEEKRFNTCPAGGETLKMLQKRTGSFIKELEEKYEGETILIISHGDPIWMLDAVAQGMDEEACLAAAKLRYLKWGDCMNLIYWSLPRNENLEVDLHRPYIDDIVLEKDGEEYRRVKEVLDVWFDSGAMPFAQEAISREKPGDFKKVSYPADFISEAIDQTRGWFYTLHAIGVLMERGRAYKNVICLGHILDKDGKKMSKSVGNVVDPWIMMERYGVDALRLWMYSVNQPGESKNFDERSVDEINKRIFNLIDNVYAFYDIYRDPSLEASSQNLEAKNILDTWILMRLSELTEKMTENLEKYRILEPVRDLRDFIDDLSTWYLRRSRDRIKDGDQSAKLTLYFALKTLSKLLAPFAPFAAEDLYQKLRKEGDPESVHLEDWPSAGKVSADPLAAMKAVRGVASMALEARSRANIKVRQPLASLRIKKDLNPAYLEILKEEINVKSVEIDPALEQEVFLDITLTPELEEEGRVRDAIREIQEIRKERGLKPGDIMQFSAPEGEKEFFTKHSEEIKRATNVEFN